METNNDNKFLQFCRQTEILPFSTSRIFLLIELDSFVSIFSNFDITENNEKLFSFSIQFDQ